MRPLFAILFSAAVLHISRDAYADAGAVSAQGSLEQRFASAATLPEEIPDFQKHVSPLLGRLGCNGRACHGSFQGRGGFRLSLFGYDFKADHDALLDKEHGRVIAGDTAESLALTKPTNADNHEGGKRFEVGSWQERVLRKWIQEGAVFEDKILKLKELKVIPSEIQFTAEGQAADVRVTAVWENGDQEDVTCLCRFQTNDPSIAEIDELGHVKAGASKGDSHVVVSYDNAVVPILVVRPVSEFIGAKYPQLTASTEVDRLVLDKLSKVGLLPADGCDDATYLRRVSLDLAGTLPTEKQVRQFLASTDPDKRMKVANGLMETEGYAAWWATRICDWTGNSATQLNNAVPSQNASSLWYEWVYKRVAENVTYDKIVEGMVTATSRMPEEDYGEYCQAMSDACRAPEKFADRHGMTFYWARNNFKTPEDRAIGFAYAFLGIRIQCAQCHKHPFDQWSQTDFEKFSRLFTQVSYNGNNVDNKKLAGDEKAVFQKMMDDLNVGKLKNGELRKKIAEELKSGATVPFPELNLQLSIARVNANIKNKKNLQPASSERAGELLGGEVVSTADDTRDDLMAWLRSPKNPYFAKAIVNRVWANYFNAGIVNPPDDLNLANPPSNAPLFDYLAHGFIESGFDLKWIHRTIVQSDTYQRSSDANATNGLDHRNFSRAIPRRLPAEVIYDAVVVATSNDDQGNQSLEQREGRAVSATDARRGGGGKNIDSYAYALSVFGRSTRESNCDCDRSEEPSVLQTIYMRNDADIHKLLADSKGWIKQVFAAGKAPSSTRDVAVDETNLSSHEMLRTSIQQLERQLAKAPDNPKRAAQMQERLDTMRKKLAESNGINLALDSAAELDVAMKNGLSPNDALRVIESAYLRTLTRPPTVEESHRSLRYMQEQKDPVEGVEGVLWALINTKEFSLNH